MVVNNYHLFFKISTLKKSSLAYLAPYGYLCEGELISHIEIVTPEKHLSNPSLLKHWLLQY